MTQSTVSRSARRSPVLRLAGAALISLAMLAPLDLANAQHGGGGHGGGGGGGHGGGGGFHGGGGRGGGFHGGGGWGGGYYGGPPVVFGDPYCAPPLVYGRGRYYNGYC